MPAHNPPHRATAAPRTPPSKTTTPAAASLSLPALLRLQARAVAGLVFRLIAFPILVTLLCRQAPGLRPARSLLEAGAGMFAIVPFALTWGRLTAARIALGRALTERGDWNEAHLVLAPFGRGGSGGWTARLFDVTGEGRYHLAQACQKIGQPDAARRLFATLAREIGERSEWGRRALAEETQRT